MTKIIKIKNKIFDNKGFIFTSLLVLSLLIPSIFTPIASQASKNTKKQVLAVNTKVIITQAPTITLVSPTPIKTIKLIPTATQAPVPTLISAIPTATPTSISSTNNSPTPTATQALVPTIMPTSVPTPTASIVPTITPTPVELRIQINIDYAGQKNNDLYSITINQDQIAWDAIVAAIGINNLIYTDYGGDMGKFITGFNNVNAASNQYFEFRVNGVSSNVGVSTYKVNTGDKLDFVLTSF